MREKKKLTSQSNRVNEFNGIEFKIEMADQPKIEILFVRCDELELVESNGGIVLF